MATKQPTYSWETSHDTANSIMTHTFSQRVQVVSNIKNGEILVKVDGNTVNAYYNTPVKEYEALLLAVEDYAYQLGRKDRIKSLLYKVAVYAIITLVILAVFALGGDNDKWSLGMFAAHKAGCSAVIAGYYSVKHTPALAAAWRSIDNGIKE